MSTTVSNNIGTVTVSKKSGRGISDGVVSELAAFFEVIPGHEQELRAACKRFAQALDTVDPKDTMKTGLRDQRHIVYDNGQRLIWMTTFETDWDPYLDDALMLVGVDHFIDWMKHTVQAAELGQWLQESGGREKLNNLTQDEVGATSAGLKSILQKQQIPAAGYWNALSDLTIPEIRKAERVDKAFQQVLDGPGASEALQHPAMQPLLEQAAV